MLSLLLKKLTYIFLNNNVDFLILVSSSPTDQDVCEIYTSTIDGCPVNHKCNIENSLPTCQKVYRGYSNSLLNMAFISPSEVENIYIS